MEVAKMLNTSQSNISYYLNSKRGGTMINKISKLIGSDSDLIAKWLATKKVDEEKLMKKYCEICEKLRKEKINYKLKNRSK